jgi:hypothetical protein
MTLLPFSSKPRMAGLPALQLDNGNDVWVLAFAARPRAAPD